MYNGPQQTGSIRGFSNIDLGQGQTQESLTPSNFSLTELRRRIEEIRARYDPDFLDSLIVTVLTHIQNLNNPHDVTLAQTGANVIELVYQAWLAQGNTGTINDFYVAFFQVSSTSIAVGSDASTANPTALITVSGVDALIADHNTDPTAHTDLINIILPGTPPTVAPTTSYIASFGVPTGATCNRSTSICVLDQNGNIVTVPANTIAVDYSTGIGTFPLYGARTNLIAPSNPTLQPTTNALGSTTSISPVGTLKVGPDGNPALILTETSTNVIHGYQFAINFSDGIEYTDTVFIYPFTNTGGITIYLDQYPTIAIMIDLSDYSVTTQNSNIFGYAQPFANGWIRLGIQYVASITGSCNLVIAKVQTATLGTTIPYLGTGALLFGIFGLQHVVGIGMSPYIPTTYATESHDSTEIIIPFTLGSVTNGIIAVSYDHPNTNGSQTRTMLSLDTNININTVSENMSVITTNTDNSTTTLTIADQFNQQIKLAYSFSPETRELATTNINTITENITVSPNITAGSVNLILGSSTTPFDGAISKFVLYPISDTSEILEFLIGQVL